ncbi:MAG: LLM class flavin-dependent oxidoreductase [Gammaproteobacteria bacterium]
MDIGLIFTGGGMRVADLARIAGAAEQAGFASLAMAEAWRSGFAPLTAMAAATSRIRIGPYVLNAYGHSPLFAGMGAIDLQDFSDGRLFCGVGGGNRIINEVWQGIPHERVLTKMREYVTILKQMARTPAGTRFTFEGAIHRMDWTPAVDPAPGPFPVVLAAVFPRMLRVAAQVADAIGGGATLSVEYLNETLRPQAASAAEAAGRDPAGLRWMAVAPIAVDADRDRARRAVREAFCHFYAPLPHPYYEYTMREQGFGAVADRLLELMPAGRLDEAVAAIPDECVDRLAIAGTVADCRRRLAEYEGVVDEMLLLNTLPPPADDPLGAYGTLLELGATA